ncbi:MAG: hypothetical protein QG657_5659, partial [Acidobacteriota bacterium]|nr:hypothetical protein [Acidobacteriota bacterium]
SIDTAHSTPAFFNSVVSLGEKMPSLRLVHLGGERLTGSVVKKISAKVSPGCKIHNGYGPTETTINCSIYTLTADQGESIDDSANIPIGRPTVLHRLYIVDRDLRPTPEGMAGELCIAGAGLASGYLNNPELTTEKFQFKRSSGSDKTSILYKTGDLARWLHDGPPAGGTTKGIIEFLGRIDHQVKIRGYRIELGEIESCLLKHPGIKEAVVIIGGHESGGNYLCAYFVSNSTTGITVTMLREHLAKELPAYMIPAYFVRMERMPLTANGKVDKKSLPAPDESDIETGSTYEAPATTLEKQLVKIWQELLRIERIGIKDDFFELGGDSILVNRCIATIRTELNVEIPMRKFFERPYINALAEEIEKQERQVSSIKPVVRIGEIPLSFAQERLWFLQELDTGNVAYFVPRVIRMKGYLDVSLLERTFTEIIRRHEILRTVFPTIDGQPVQRIQPPFPFKIPVLDWSGLKKEEQELRVSHFLNEENRKPFDFEKGPLLRVTILKLNEEEHLFVLTEHHLVHDGWTQGVLLNEIITIFSAYLEGRNHNLPELPIQYADYTIWERSYLQGERLKRHLDYWLEKLSGLIPVLELPVDRPRPAVISSQGALNVFRISSTLTDQLREFSRENGTTLFVTMLAAFKVLLYRYTGVNDICVGTGIANRGRKEMENMLGMVINSLPLRTHTPGDIPFRQYLLHVKETCLEAYQRQETPFGKIVEALGQERSLSYSPVFQVMLSFMDTPTEELHLPGLELHQEETHNHSAKFDLDLVVVPPMQREGGMAVEINEGEILVEWEYNTDIFEAETIARMICHYIRLLEVVTLQPDVSIANLPMLGEDELKRILYEWNDTEADYPRGKTVHEL